MKKSLAFILCVALCLSILTGCKKTPEYSPSQAPSPSPEPTQAATPSPLIPVPTPPTTPLPTAAPIITPAETPIATPSTGVFPFTEENFPRIDGSTATIPLIEAVTSALLKKPRSEITVTVSKTSGAYIALKQKKADILFVYDGGDETRTQVKADVSFETVSIGKDALVFLVNRDNPVENLTKEQVQKIFSGEYTNWSELGGSNYPIRAYQRGEGSGSQALMDKLAMPGLTMADPAKVPVVGNMGGLIEAVADFAGGPSGIGYNVYYYVTEMRGNDYIKILSIDGVEPNYDTIQSGKYPFVSDFYSVIRKEEPINSPARALHEWMLTDEAQNLIASENYVALHANPAADTPYVDGKFSFYPEGESPKYFEGVDPYNFVARDDYGRLYFYLGSKRHVDFDWSGSPEYYGICTEAGKIVTEPIYSVPLLLIDSKGNHAYFCYRSDRDPVSVTNPFLDKSYKENLYPILLFALDGSWLKEFDCAVPFSGYFGPANTIMNSDVLAVMLNGKWGAVNMRGETVIPISRYDYVGIYPPADGGTGALAVTADRFVYHHLDNPSGRWLSNLYDANGNLIAVGLYGTPQHMSGDFILTYEWGGTSANQVHTYTLDGELIATLSAETLYFDYAAPMGDYVCIYTDSSLLICDRSLKIIYELPGKRGDIYSEAYRLGPNVLFSSDSETLLHRTYLPDGTRLVTWYDSEMS